MVVRVAFSLTAFVAAGVLIPAALIALPTQSAHADDVPTASVIVDEVAAGGPQGSSGSFFELRNASHHPVDLTGWSIYRCDEEGLRAKLSRPEVDLSGVILAPGELFTATHMGWPGEAADAVFTQALPAQGFGLVVVGPDGDIVDSVAVYPSAPEPTQSECGTKPNLPVTLAIGLGESWQRTPTGWARAHATPDAANALSADPTASRGPRVSEIAAAGPEGHGDDFVELVNDGSEPLPLEGWRLFRCTAAGVLAADTLQHEFGPEEVLEPGERLVVGGPRFSGDAVVRTRTSLADLVSGVLLVSPDGRRGDGVTVSSRGDTGCQTGDAKLPASLDYRSGESWQRLRDGTFVAAARTPGAPNAHMEHGLVDHEFAYDTEMGVIGDSVPAGMGAGVRPGTGAGVAISEFVVDPRIEGAVQHHFVELGNYAAATIDISGWRLIACGADGFRRFDDLAAVPAGTRIPPGGTWYAALSGTPAAAAADAHFDQPLALAGAGVWVEDADGRRIDSVGSFHRNEMDDSVERESPCTKGLSLPTFGADRLRGETYQRADFTADDSRDFVAAPASPGRIDDHPSADAAGLAADALDAATVRTTVADAAAGPGKVRASGAARAFEPAGSRMPIPVAPASAPPARVVDAFAGATQGALTEHRRSDEVELAPAEAALTSREDRYDHPYLRLVVEAPTGGGTVTWSGRTVGRAQVQLSVWDPDAASWRLLDTATGARVAVDPTAEEHIDLTGEITAAEVVDGIAELLVQSVPRASTPVTTAAGIADPADYDLAISHLTDTQYYAEAYPEVYASQVAWIAANAVPRRIAFATHTGDLIQSWIDPDQHEDRARREFEIASEFQRVLDDAGVANSVLPGNHDNKRGVTNDLFNEYFPPERYADAPWYGGSIAEGDNSANWSSFTAAGAAFVMISLPYAYGEREVAWAETVVTQHPEANIVISTHEHLTPKTQEQDAERSTTSRWVSHGDMLWERVIAPNRNVVLVLSGHFHGLGAIVTEDAGGIAGHTVIEALADYQEFRTHTGERATGFQRLLQFDLAAGMFAVDTFSVGLGASASHPYDYEQFVPDNGLDTTASNERPWRVIERGLQHRYTEADDAFAVELEFQHAKAVETDGVSMGAPPAAPQSPREPVTRR